MASPNLTGYPTGITPPTIPDEAVFTHRVVAAVICCIVSCFGICGNLFVLFAISASKRLQSASNRFVGFLAVTDLFTCLLLPVQVAALLGARSWFFRMACGVAGVIGYVTLGSSAFTLVLIAFNRYICLTQSLEVQKRFFSSWKAAAMVSFGVTFPLVITGAFVGSGRARTGQLYGLICTITYGPLLDIVAGSFLLSCVVIIIVFYVLILRVVRGHTRRVRPAAVAIGLRPSGRQPHRPDDVRVHVPDQFPQANRAFEAPEPMVKLETEVTKNMAMVVLAFVIAVSFVSLSILCPGMPSMYDAYAYVILSANSGINPVIYGWKHPLFKKTFRCLLKWKLEEVDQPTRWVRRLISF